MSSTVNKIVLAAPTLIVHTQSEELRYFHVVVLVGELILPDGPYRTPPQPVSAHKAET